MKLLFYLTLPFYLASALQAQTPSPGYRLSGGSEYGLSLSVSQNTVTEAGGIEQNVSLDISGIYWFRVDSTDLEGNYMISVHFSHLALSMVAPLLNISLNPGTTSGKTLQNYLDYMENKYWQIRMAPSGKILEISGLKGLFNNMYSLPASEPGEQEVIIKTLSEAFGEEAMYSFSNMVLNIYPDVPATYRWETVNTHYINTRPVTLSNNWYFSINKSGQRLIQGLGLIFSDYSDTIVQNGISVCSAVKGNQTYDYIADPETGWLLSGNSRQRIVVTNLILNNPSFPQGLEVPSYTETLYILKEEQKPQAKETEHSDRKGKKRK
ncbi:MAG: DUF6263 family protein [Bacteroidota bacterium]